VSVGGMLSLNPVLRKPWLGLDHFWTLTGWSKMDRPGGVEITDLAYFSGYVDPARGSLGFL
jgi:hypothetical protein